MDAPGNPKPHFENCFSSDFASRPSVWQSNWVNYMYPLAKLFLVGKRHDLLCGR